nr:mitochondrial import inner membrane translocase subunit [Dugesia japonica]
MSDLNNPVFMSPFLNFDPSLLVSNPKDQYIHVDGSEERGRFERSCCEIGGMVVLGGAYGGFKAVIPALWSRSLRESNRSLIISQIAKSSATFAQSIGAIGLIYAGCDSIFHYSLKQEDSVTNILAATATGLIYSSGNFSWQKAMKCGGFGLAFGCAIASFSNYDKLKSYFRGMRY